jgi:hypothetical protein
MPARKLQAPRPIEDPAEYQRFLDMAKEVEADETPGALDRAFDKVVRPPTDGPSRQQTRTASTKGRSRRDQSR